MFKLVFVVLVSSWAWASAAPSIGHHVAAVSHAIPAPIATYAAAAPIAVAPAAVAVQSPTVVESYTSLSSATVPVVSKQVHYENQPVVTGYTATHIKPNLGHLLTPGHSVYQQRVLAPSRLVKTVTPEITHVQPELHVQKVAVDVPVQKPVISQVELRTPQIHTQTQPIFAAVPAAHHAVAVSAIATAPGIAAAPAIATSYNAAIAAPAIAAPAIAAPAIAAPAIAAPAIAAPAIATSYNAYSTPLHYTGAHLVSNHGWNSYY